ncbi:peptidoglycan DD-metalloendopeptidase family protein [Roseibium polysiphoniae]|uniref:peptidoglycan DD-metalloendopeptidase family protein n=1 Tax=Roseibium polysiphoniae TaxID=2571221 RepID=UPI003297D008
MPLTPFSQDKPYRHHFALPGAEHQQSARPPERRWPLALSPRTAIVLASMISVLTIGAVGTAGYWVLRGDMLETAQSRQAAIETAYQDRIERLRAEIDRLNSRQAIDRESVELQVSDLIRRQQTLNQRHAVVTSLMKRAERNGIQLASSKILPTKKPETEPDPLAIVAEDAELAIGGEPELLEDPLKALGLRGTSSAMPDESVKPLAPTPGEQAALDQVEQDILAMNQESVSALDALAVATETQIDTILAATRPLGVNLTPAGTASGRSGIGGPYIPYTGGGFTGRVKRAERALVALDSLKTAAKRLPISRPMQNVKISSHFGPRIDPFLGKFAMHTGMDFKASYGARVYSSAPGTVVHAGRKGGYGKLVEIRHANGFVSRYAHLSRMHVSKDDHVTTGDVIGNVGSTGRSTGPHLHYEIRMGKEPLDPAAFVTAGDRLSKLIDS